MCPIIITEKQQTSIEMLFMLKCIYLIERDILIIGFTNSVFIPSHTE